MVVPRNPVARRWALDVLHLEITVQGFNWCIPLISTPIVQTNLLVNSELITDLILTPYNWRGELAYMSPQCALAGDSPVYRHYDFSGLVCWRMRA